MPFRTVVGGYHVILIRISVVCADGPGVCGDEGVPGCPTLPQLAQHALGAGLPLWHARTGKKHPEGPVS